MDAQERLDWIFDRWHSLMRRLAGTEEPKPKPQPLRGKLMPPVKAPRFYYENEDIEREY